MDAFEEILKRLKSAEQDIEGLNRGVYGDDKNEVLGILQKLNLIEGIVKKIQDDRRAEKLKIVSFCMGAGFIIGCIGWLIEHFLIR